MVTDYHEKRNDLRFAVEDTPLVVMLAEEFDPLVVKMKDISSDGAYLVLPEPFEPGARVKVEFPLPINHAVRAQPQQCYMRMYGTVVRQDEEGMGVHFEKRESHLRLSMAYIMKCLWYGLRQRCLPETGAVFTKM
ncbi:MAG: PilZ domain-containing protein [Deltaproteobacteria bacterium]|nr:PilZ domain-containing protein [Deltaproteobacteria bacterium]